VDHQRKTTLFASSSTVVDIWDRSRAEPLHSFSWGADSVHFVRFNPVETNVLCSAAADRYVLVFVVCPPFAFDASSICLSSFAAMHPSLHLLCYHAMQCPCHAMRVAWHE
jgi:hypothetical protein